MARAFVYVRVGVFVRVSVISEIKHSFQSLRYLINHLLLIYPEFMSCGTIILFLYVQVTWRHVERPIAQFDRDR